MMEFTRQDDRASYEVLSAEGGLGTSDARRNFSKAKIWKLLCLKKWLEMCSGYFRRSLVAKLSFHCALNTCRAHFIGGQLASI